MEFAYFYEQESDVLRLVIQNRILSYLAGRLFRVMK